LTLLPPGRTERQTCAVAHELNNVLTVVRTYTHFARQPTTPEQQARDLVVVAAAAERAGALVDWLACKSEETPRAADELSANEFVSMLSARLQQLIPAGATVEIMRIREDVCFHANGVRLEHIVMSLVLAASQRSAETAFKFAVERAVVDDQHAGLAAGEYAVVSISCTELKLSSSWREEPIPAPDQVAALLEPLTNLLQTMHGNLEVRSSAGQLRFEIYLPAACSVRRKPESPRLALVPPSAETVCIVENETAIRLAMVRTLASAGFLVLEANDGAVARTLLIEHGHAVTLLVCDAGLISDGEDFFG
jgi:two-component system cell cycle sensor histidine kinase/response regulator CckA